MFEWSQKAPGAMPLLKKLAQKTNTGPAQKNYNKKLLFSPARSLARKSTTNYYPHPGPARNDQRDYFRARLWAGCNHYFLVILLYKLFHSVIYQIISR